MNVAYKNKQGKYVTYPDGMLIGDNGEARIKETTPVCWYYVPGRYLKWFTTGYKSLKVKNI